MSALMAVRAIARIPGQAWTPADLGASLSAWYDAAGGTYVTRAGDPLSVSQWSDRSGNARHATQGTFVNQPRWGLTTDRVDFLGGNDFLTLPSAISFSTTSRCVAAVARVNAGETGNQALVGPSAAGGFGMYLRTTDDKFQLHKTNTAMIGSAGVVTTAADHVFLANMTSSTWRLSLDGTASTGSHSTTFTASLTGFMGKHRILGTDYDWLNGNIGELVICAELSEADQQKLEGYLAHRWGLSGNLPNDHPYKSAAP